MRVNKLSFFFKPYRIPSIKGSQLFYLLDILLCN